MLLCQPTSLNPPTTIIMAHRISSLLCIIVPVFLSLQHVGAFSYDSPSNRADIFKRAGPVCTADNGTSYTDGAGDTYTVVCDVNIGGSNYLQGQGGASLSDCADQCSAYNKANDGGCLAVILYQGQCYLKGTTGQDSSPGSSTLR